MKDRSTYHGAVRRDLRGVWGRVASSTCRAPPARDVRDWQPRLRRGQPSPTGYRAALTGPALAALTRAVLTPAARPQRAMPCAQRFSAYKVQGAVRRDAPRLCHSKRERPLDALSAVRSGHVGGHSVEWQCLARQCG
jgi:hypothetical protein